MSSVAELFKQASELSDDERATLAGLLIESLETEFNPDVEKAWETEIERRLAELDSGAVKTVPMGDRPREAPGAPWQVVKSSSTHGTTHGLRKVLFFVGPSCPG